jgi:hypothetical protein
MYLLLKQIYHKKYPEQGHCREINCFVSFAGLCVPVLARHLNKCLIDRR